MCDNAYKYPDKNDKATFLWAQEVEPYPGYWQKSDSRYVNYIDKFISRNKFSNAIDIGCGYGRLVFPFHKYFDKMIALEPDISRLEPVIKWVDKENIKNVEIINSTLLDSNLKENSFDFVLCSHVIQHVSTKEINLFIHKIYSILKNNGYLILITTHSKQHNNYYVKSIIQDGKVVEPVISEDEFNKIINNKDNMLPCILFSLKYLYQLLSNFKIKKVLLHHALYKRNVLDKIIFRDKLLNLPFIKGKLGSDVLLICKKG